MPLSFEDRIKLFVPASLYYPHKIRKEIAEGEPELAILASLIKRDDGIAVDVGANRGVYSYALSKLCRNVVAFEPNPDLAEFCRRKLPRTVDLNIMALGAVSGHGALQIPIDAKGRDEHLTATLLAAPDNDRARTVPVEMRTLDSMNLRDVALIKIDVEGTELAVVQGGLKTIQRDKPILVVELLTSAHPNSVHDIEEICSIGYDAKILIDNTFHDAIPEIKEHGQASTRNIVFFSN